MHATDLILVRPAAHQLVNIPIAQRFVKLRFDIVGIAAYSDRLKFGFWHRAIIRKCESSGRSSYLSHAYRAFERVNFYPIDPNI
jgi:hypothetical protein